MAWPGAAQALPSAATSPSAALPWGRPELSVGDELELREAGAQGTRWLSATVEAALGDHRYALYIEVPADSEEEEEEEEEEEHEGGDAAAAEAAAEEPAPEADRAAKRHKPSSAARVVPAEELPQDLHHPEFGERVTVYEAAATLLSDAALEVALDGAEGPATRFEWRPAADSMQQLMERAFLGMAETQRLPKGVDLPAASDLAAAFTQRMEEVVSRAVALTSEAGSKTVTAGRVLAAMQEAGLPAVPMPPELMAAVEAEQRAEQHQQEQQPRGGGAGDV